jgi:sulfoxide reductase catalytic subunit YedY
MSSRWERYTSKMGLKLKRLHVWNAWVVLALALSGIVLYVPALRGITAPIRVALKQGHIAIGVVSIVLLLLYVPFIRKHGAQLRDKAGQLSNLVIVLALLVGWSVSGLILWMERSLPPVWTSGALLAHDLLTWVGVPYAIYHSVTRSRWVRERRAAAAPAEELHPAASTFPLSRRGFLKVGLGTVLALVLGPIAYRWLKQATDNGGATLDRLVVEESSNPVNGQELLTPLPSSSPPIGGGAEGNFRIYTVTDIPRFKKDAWSFSIKGLVDQPVALDWEAFTKLQRTVQVSDFHCVTGWSVYHVTWEGITLKSLLERAGVQSSAKYVKLYSGDGVYTDTLTLDQAMMDDVMVAALIDGKPIPEDLGGPVRLVVPQMYAYKSVKWLQSIELIQEEHVGYWEVRGYDTDAWVPGAVKT